MTGIQLMNESENVYPVPALPVGYVYISYEPYSPASMFGGTWEQISQCFLLGSSGDYSVGQTGGSETVTLTVENLPSHTHSLAGAGGYDTNRSNLGKTKYSGTGSYVVGHTKDTGGDEPHNNMPPHHSVYMWEKIA